MQKILQTIDYNYIISMSGDSLNNLIAMVAKERQASLYQIPLLIISKRMALVAQALGFKDILIAQNASEEALIAALVSRRREEHDARGSKYRDF